MSLTFNLTPEGKVHIVRGEYTKELNKEAFVEILQLLVANIAPNRDYSNVISIKKLLRVIDLECEPDESDNDEPAVEPQGPVPVPAPVTAPEAKKAPPRRRAAPQKKEEDDDE